MKKSLVAALLMAAVSGVALADTTTVGGGVGGGVVGGGVGAGTVIGTTLPLTTMATIGAVVAGGLALTNGGNSTTAHHATTSHP